MIYIEIPGDCDYIPVLKFLGDPTINALKGQVLRQALQIQKLSDECNTLSQECNILANRADAYQKLADFYRERLAVIYEATEDMFDEI